MAEERRRERERRVARSRDRIGALLVVALACVAGVIAGTFATPKAWESQTVSTPTTQGSR